MGCRMVFCSFLVAFRIGWREEKHGIYCVGHTLPTLVKNYVSYSFWTPFLNSCGNLGAHLCVQMFPWERSWEVDVEARAGRVQGRNHFAFLFKKASKRDWSKFPFACFLAPCLHTWSVLEKSDAFYRFGTHFGGHLGASAHIFVLRVFLEPFLRSRNKGKIRQTSRKQSLIFWDRSLAWKL